MMNGDIEYFIQLMKKKYPQHLFEISIGGNDVFIYGKNDETLYSYAQNLNDCMSRPVERIAYVKSE